MRLIPLVAFIRLAATSIVEDTACALVGLRLARTVSWCERGICAGLKVDAVSRAIGPAEYTSAGSQVLSCGVAVYFGENLIESILANSDPGLMERGVEALRSDIRDIIIPAFDRMIVSVGRLGLTSDELDAMARVIQTLDQVLITQHPSAPAVREMAELEKLISITHDLVKQSGFQSHFVDTYTGLTAPLVHFALDIYSHVADFNRSDFQRLKPFTVIGITHPPIFRPRRSNEFHHPSIPETRNILMIAKEIDFWVRVGGRECLDSRGFANLARYLSMKPPAEPSSSATDGLLMHQIVSDLCPVIESLIECVRGGLNPLWRKTVLTIVEICEGNGILRSDGLLDASLSLMGRSQEDPGYFQSFNVQEIAAALMIGRSSVSWHSFYPIEPVQDALELSMAVLRQYVSSSDTLEYPLDGSGGIFRPASWFSSFEEFESRYRGLGRAMALVQREGGSADDEVMLLPELWGVVLYPIKADPPERHASTSELLENVYRPSYYIRVGMRDVLGPIR